jgi:hypothetical protein
MSTNRAGQPCHIAEGAHAVLLLDSAGWHTTAKLDVSSNIAPIFLPSRAPELDPVENIWQFLRGDWLSNLVFETYDDIIDAACDAWRKLVASQKRSPPPECETGPTSVRPHDSWHKPKHGRQTVEWILERPLRAGTPASSRLLNARSNYSNKDLGQSYRSGKKRIFVMLQNRHVCTHLVCCNT